MEFLNSTIKFRNHKKVQIKLFVCVFNFLLPKWYNLEGAGN